jgi:hypothetical protein
VSLGKLTVKGVHLSQGLSEIIIQKSDFVVVSGGPITVAVQRIDFPIIILEHA